MFAQAAAPTGQAGCLFVFHLLRLLRQLAELERHALESYDRLLPRVLHALVCAAATSH
jgi:hypothetical protein